MNKSIIWDLRSGLSVDDLRENRKLYFVLMYQYMICGYDYGGVFVRNLSLMMKENKFKSYFLSFFSYVH